MPTKTKSPGSAKKPKKTPAVAQRDGALMLDAAPVVVPNVSHDDIARRAFELYERRSYQGGSELHDWLAAERELRAS